MHQLNHRTVLAAALAALLPIAAAQATIDLQVTEVYIGIDGPDGTPDWFELTNFGDMDADTADYSYDDGSANFANSVALPSFILGAGQSAIILIEADVNDVADFHSLWGSNIRAGTVAGSGLGLGAGGDGVNIFLNSDQSVVDSMTYTGAFAGGLGLSTIDVSEDEFDAKVLAASQVGVNGGYASNPFFNDTIGVEPDFEISLIGSPTPEPATLALLGLGGLALIRRRR